MLLVQFRKKLKKLSIFGKVMSKPDSNRCKRALRNKGLKPIKTYQRCDKEFHDKGIIKIVIWKVHNKEIKALITSREEIKNPREDYRREKLPPKTTNKDARVQFR